MIPLLASLLAATLSGTAIHVEKVEGTVSHRAGAAAWVTLKAGDSVAAGDDVRVGTKGAVRLRFPEKSVVYAGSGTTIHIESVRNAGGEPLIEVRLSDGRVSVEVAAATVKREAMMIGTPAALVVVKGTRCSVRHDAKSWRTTVSATEGAAFVQPEGRGLWPLELSAGEQVSLNTTVTGPVVAAGAPPTLEEKKPELDLGQWQVCEKGVVEICGTWNWDTTRQRFDAKWGNGAEAVLNVEKIGGGEIVLVRRDTKGSTPGLTARYTGHREGDRIIGDVAFDVISGTVTWTEEGRTTSGTWSAESSRMVDFRK